MLNYDGIDVSQRINVNKTNKSKECDTCCYRYFLDKEVKFQADVCNKYNDVLMMSMNICDIAILGIDGADYCSIVNGISKNKAIYLV